MNHQLEKRGLFVKLPKGRWTPPGGGARPPMRQGLASREPHVCRGSGHLQGASATAGLTPPEPPSDPEMNDPRNPHCIGPNERKPDDENCSQSCPGDCTSAATPRVANLRKYTCLHDPEVPPAPPLQHRNAESMPSVTQIRTREPQSPFIAKPAQPSVIPANAGTSISISQPIAKPAQPSSPT